jgi:hypothetical protein
VAAVPGDPPAPARARPPSPSVARIALVPLVLLAAACTGPRSVLLSPEATPKGRIRAGGAMDVNIPTQTSGTLFGNLENGIGYLADRISADTALVEVTARELNDLTLALIAYSLDPLGANATLHVRYGLWPRLDAGYRFAGGAHALDARVQFLGSIDGEAPAGPGWRGSLAVQYSGQDYELPSFLGELQGILKYRFARKDILVPLVLGKPLGADGRFGSFGLGAAWNLALIEYDSEILRLVEKVDGEAARPFEDLRGERAIHSFGGFANARLGYRRLFLLAGMSAFWQDYGTFKLFGGERASLSGWTFAPSFGLEASF